MIIKGTSKSYIVARELHWFRTLIVAAVFLSGASHGLAAVSAIDDEGTLVELSQPATRVISLAPSLTELLFAAGAGGQIVGVVDYSDFPPEANEIQVVGRHDLLDMERILQLDPDLIVAWQSGNPRTSVARLRELGFPVYIAEPKLLESIPSHIERLARLTGTSAVGNQEAADFRETLAALSAQYSDAAPVSVFYQVWDLPLISAGGNELIDDIITLCGGRNIFADITLVAPKVSTEAVLARNPSAIIASGMDIHRPEWLDDWKRWPSLTAIKHGNLFFVPPELLQRHTPRALLGAQMLCEQIAVARDSLGNALTTM